MKKFYLLLLMLISSSMAWATGIDANPSLNNDGSNDPHMSGVWLLMLDRNNNELWYEMSLANEYGDYSYILRTYCYIFGCKYYWDSQLCDYTPIDNTIPSRNYRGNEDIITYDARFCFVINGVRYGPEENYKEVVFGDALSNPLVESNNYFTMMTGIIVNMGVAFDEDGKAYAYAGHANWGQIAYLSDNENFPDPHKIGVWLLMLDRNNNELWKEMEKEEDYYTCFERLYCHVFGCRYYSNMWFFNYTPIDPNIPSRRYADCEDLPTIYDARYCIVIDGVRYGPEENYTESIPGNTTANPLAESNNYYTLKTGEFATVGVLFDEGGKAYAYVAYAMMSYSDPTQKWRENFPPYETNNNSSNGDVNGDGEINIGDVNAIIDIIQGH
jgi:hypothetical protein